MDLNKYPTQHPQVATRTVEDAAVIVLADSGEVTVLNPVGTSVWGLADGRRSVQEIIAAVEAEYEVSPEQAREDVTAFLLTLVDAGALILADQPVPAGGG